MVVGFLSGLFESKGMSFKASPTSHVLSFMGGTVRDGAVPPSDVDRMTKQYYERVIWVFRCIDVIATNGLIPHLQLVQGDPVDGKVVQNDAVNRVLNIRANQYEDALMFRYRLISQLLLSSRGAFIEPKWTNGPGSDLAEVHLLPPGSVTPLPDPNTFVRGYKVKTADNEEEVISADRLVWLKVKPHPLDPYKQMTPLMAAGVAADTDWLARLFNRNFLANDGRPGLLISVDGELNPTDADEMRRRFSGGPRVAGQTSVVEGSVHVNDLSATPRDAQWSEAIDGSKQDIMLAFGVPESVMGNASGRTYDNADAEKENFWDATELPLLDALARGLDPLTGNTNDDVQLRFNYEKVAVLQRQKQARIARALNDFTTGVLTLNDYLKIVGSDEINVPAARTYIQQNGLLIATNAEDQAAVDKMVPIGAHAMPEPGGGVPGEQGGQDASAQIESGFRQLGNQQAAQGILSASSRQGLLSLIQGGKNAIPTRWESQRALQRKEDNPNIIDATIVDDDVKNLHPYAATRLSLEGQIEGVVLGWSNQQTRIIPERLEHAKVRKGTRHWDGEGVGEKALNPTYVVEIDRWAKDLKSDMARVLTPIANREMQKAIKDMDGSGIATLMHKHGLGNEHGQSGLMRVFGTKANYDKAVAEVMNPLYEIVDRAARNQSQKIAALVKEMDSNGATLSDIKGVIKSRIGSRSAWQHQFATYMTTAVIEGINDKAYGMAGDITTKLWNTEEDEKVRPAHRHVDGKEVPTNKSFTVEGVKMRYPGDPTAPLNLTANCRCWVDRNINEKYAEEYDMEAI